MGGSDRPDFPVNQSAETAENFFLESLDSWREGLGIEKFVLAGHSLGGFLSASYSLRYPEHVQKLLLISPVGVPAESRYSRDDKDMPFLLKSVKYFWERNYTPQMVVRFFGHYGPTLLGSYTKRAFHRVPETDRALLHDYTYHINAAPASGELSTNGVLSFGALARRPLFDRMHLMQAPVHFFYGETDWMDSSAAESLREKLKVPSDLTIVANAGHHLYLDNPATFNKHFIASVLGR